MLGEHRQYSATRRASHDTTKPLEPRSRRLEHIRLRSTVRRHNPCNRLTTPPDTFVRREQVIRMVIVGVTRLVSVYGPSCEYTARATLGMTLSLGHAVSPGTF